MTTDYCDLDTPNLVAKRRWRGISTLDLVVTTQEASELLELWQTNPQLAADIAGGNPEKAKDYQYYYACVLSDCGKEIQRRRSMSDKLQSSPDNKIIRAISILAHLHPLDVLKHLFHRLLLMLGNVLSCRDVVGRTLW